MKRMKSKLPERLEIALRGLAAPKKLGYGEYCAEVVETFFHGAVETQRRKMANIPGVRIPESFSDAVFCAEKCTEDLVVYLSDDTAGCVCAMVNNNPNTSPSEVLRWILTLHVDGFSHIASLMLNTTPGQGH